MLPVVTDVLERQQIIFRNWYVVFKALSLLESGNFRHKQLDMCTQHGQALTRVTLNTTTPTPYDMRVCGSMKEQFEPISNVELCIVFSIQLS